MKTIFSRIGWPRFRLQSLLLTTLVAATVSDVFLRPKTPVRTMAFALKIESLQTEVKSPNGAEPSKWLDQGTWRVLTRSGRLLAVGAHNQGEAIGTWRYFDESGEMRAEGECQKGQPVGRWVNFTDEGAIAREAMLQAVAAAKPADSDEPRPTPPVFDKRRPSMSIADATKRLSSARYQDRCLALHQLVSHGDAALPALMDVVEQLDHPARRQVIHWLSQAGPEASSLVPRLRKLASSNGDPLQCEIRTALLWIDPQRANEYLKSLLEDVAIHKASTAMQLHRALDREPERYASRLAVFVKDERPEVRRLVAGLLLKRFEQISSATMSAFPWYSDFFGLGLTPNYDDESTPGSWHNPARCDKIIEQLTILQNDSDPDIRAVADKVIAGWNDEEILANTPIYRSHSHGCFF